MSGRYIREMLAKYKKTNSVRFHMPGHKGKININDVTEIGMTDNLNNPQTFILQAQRALSECYQSTASYFLVNGSTGGIHTMLKYASLQSEYPVLIPRNSHKSIISACMLFDIEFIVVDEVFDEEQQIFLFNEKKIIEYIKNTKLAAVVITSVDYFGRVIDLSEIAEACKKNKVLLLCDEAHGAHFHINSMLPESALKYADICVHSPHKTLSALTQSSYIHISENIENNKFEYIMYSLQTSSPSFLLVESMDNARYYSITMKREWEKRAAQAKVLEKKLNSIFGITIKSTDWAMETGYSDKDTTRLIIDVSGMGNGIEISKILEDQYNIFMEMATFKYIVAILTPWDRKKWDRMLVKAFQNISKTKIKKVKIPEYPAMNIKEKRIVNTERCKWEKVKFEDAEGRISAQPIGAYPPGVPIVLPGERISKETKEYLLEIENLGGSIFGLTEGYAECIKEEP